MKIRINDLARELEVKSKQILDVLIKVGVTEKKTHSSSVEADEAEKVRKYFHEISGAPNRHRGGGEEFRPKIDLSKISKPGDALKAILARKEQPVETVARSSARAAAGAAQGHRQQARRAQARASAAPVVAERAPRLVTPESVAQRSQVSTVELPKPAGCRAAARAAEPAAPPVAAAPPAPVEAPVAAARLPPESAVPAPPAASRARPLPTLLADARRTAPAVASTRRSTPRCRAARLRRRLRHADCSGQACWPQAAASGSARPPLAGQPPAPPARRMIVPQTGPRPVYTAPPPPPPRAPQPPSAMGNRPGLPVRGQPIFQRPRPGQSRSRRCLPGAAWCSRRASAVPSRRAPSHAPHPHRSHSGRTSAHGGWTSGHGNASRWSAASGWFARCRSPVLRLPEPLLVLAPA